MGGHLLVPLDPESFFPAEVLMRLALTVFGYDLQIERRTPAQGTPMLTVSRHANGFFLSGYCPNTTVVQHLRFPQGAPILLGLETEISDSSSCYAMPRAWRRECRVFVEQEADGEISCRERHSGMVGVKRRFWLGGSEEATVRFYHEPGTESDVKMLCDPVPPYLVGDFVEYSPKEDGWGCYLEAEGITGELLISW